MMINSDQMKNICHSKGCPVTSKYSVPASGINAGVFSHANGHKCDKCHMRYIVPSILHPLSQFGNGCDRLWRKSMFPLHHVPYRVQLARDLGRLLVTAVIVLHQEHVASHKQYVDMRCPTKKVCRLPVEEMAAVQDYQLVQCSGHCSIYPAETPNVTEF